jgi:hypothetical protein
MISALLFVLGLAVGIVAGPFLLPMLQDRFPALARRIEQAPLPIMPSSPLRSKIEAAIADNEHQMRNRVDVDRNVTRLAQLRELLADEGGAA